MLKKILSYSIVISVAIALVAGTGYILLRPAEAQERGAQRAGQLGNERWNYEQGQGQGRGNGGGQGAAGSQGAGIQGQEQFTALTAEEIASILYMREEEKLARDVYLALYEQWELSIFQNIASSEQSHMDAVETLIDRHGLDDPVEGNEAGIFTNDTLQSLYDELTATGSQSLADALRVGAAIEEIDILDSEEYLAQTDAPDVQRVYENLLRGSRNHLRSFTATLKQQTGETYAPQYLDQEAYEDIINAPIERGSATQGQGQGRGNGGRGVGTGNRDADGQGQGGNETAPVAWRTLTGQVTAVDPEIIIQTTEDEVLVGMGQYTYRQDFALSVGDEITVRGFYEDGEFKAGTVENTSTGETITLRDESGRPLWAGQGERKNQRVLNN